MFERFCDNGMPEIEETPRHDRRGDSGVFCSRGEAYACSLMKHGTPVSDERLRISRKRDYATTQCKAFRAL